MLHGFTDQSNRWFNIKIANLLKPIIFPGDNIYFLAASGNFFLFVSNTCREVIAVNLVTKAVRKIPPSPLGPRGTSLWRRSGMKLVSGSDHFRFLFAELVDNHPILFVYASETNKWQSREAREGGFFGFPCGSQRESECVFLNMINGPYESVVIAVGSECDAPVIVRPKFHGTQNYGQPLTVDRLYVYGDWHMLMTKSNGVNDVGTEVRMLHDIELWGLGLNGSQWEYISKVPCKIMEQIRKPYRVMKGCLEGREGIIRAVLLSNFEGLWDIIWLSYDLGRSQWTWVPLPNCKMNGLTIAGIAFSYGLTLS